MLNKISSSPVKEKDVKARLSPGLRILVALTGLLLLGGIGAATFALTTDQRPGGDPGENVLRNLEKIRSAVPPGASDILVHSYPATWMGPCASDPSSHAGWVEDLVNVRFTDTAPANTVRATIDAALQPMGWVRHDIVIARGQGATAHWSRPVRGGRQAEAFAFPTPAGSSAWVLTSTWQPPGPVVDTGNCA
jgi:hypothetical protein